MHLEKKKNVKVRKVQSGEVEKKKSVSKPASQAPRFAMRT
jgi:hypothetical protein